MFRFLFSVFLISKLHPRHETSRVSTVIDFVLQVLVVMAVAWLMNLHRKVVVPMDTSTLPHNVIICNNFVKDVQFKA